MRYFYPTSIGMCSGVSLRLLRLSCSMPCFQLHEKLPGSPQAYHLRSTLRIPGSATRTLHSWSRSNVSRSINLSSGGVVRIFISRRNAAAVVLILDSYSPGGACHPRPASKILLLVCCWKSRLHVLRGAEEGMECSASKGVPLLC